MTQAIDWNLARAIGMRTAPRGPDTTPEKAAASVALLRDMAAEAEQHVRATSLLNADAAPPAVVVDRPGWIRSNLEGFDVVLAPAIKKLEETSGTLTMEVGSRLTGTEIGVVLGWLSGKVLGQYETFRPEGEQARLLLVAPNIVATAEQLRVDLRDFALWVCLHEETHRVQFGANPWLSDYMLGEIHTLMDTSEMGAAELARRVGAAAVTATKVLRGDPHASMIEAVQSPAQREIFDRLTAVMSLLEGHADVVTDTVGPEVVPSVATIRERFDKRRAEPGQFDGILRRLLGLDAKMRQYSDGAAFVRGVTARVGTEGFNAVWTSPAHLPTRDEIANPAAWVRRVHLRP